MGDIELMTLVNYNVTQILCHSNITVEHLQILTFF